MAEREECFQERVPAPMPKRAIFRGERSGCASAARGAWRGFTERGPRAAFGQGGEGAAGGAGKAE